MLEPPDIPDSKILARLWDEYGLRARRLSFLPLGVDTNSAVYRVEVGGTSYFLKLRMGNFDEISVLVPRFLHEQGLKAVIPPLETRRGELWGQLDAYRMILYPFVDGQDGYERPLSAGQWQVFGAAMGAIHAAALPPELRSRIPLERFSVHDRERVRNFQRRAEMETFVDPIAADLAAFMRQQRDKISQLVEQAERLAGEVQSRPQNWVLCHGDLHPGNLLLSGDAPQDVYLVDWDTPLYAPHERDLALIGGTGAWSASEDVERFYRGYRLGEINPAAIRYYRIERVVVDIAEFCEQLLASDRGGEDRAQAYRYFTGAFLPGHEIDLALEYAAE